MTSTTAQPNATLGRTLRGVVVSDKMTKAAVVLLERNLRHPLYQKIIKIKKKIHVSNEIGAKTGQLVEVTETRPISKTISYKIEKLIKPEDK